MTRERAGIAVLAATLAAALILGITGAGELTGAGIILGLMLSMWLMRWG